MEKFKPTVISKEFISSVTDSVQNQNAISFAESVASSASLSDDQAMNNNYQKSQSYSRDVTGIVTGYKNADTNTIVANVKVSNQSLSADVKISTIMIFANYNGNKILVATSRLNEPELLPAFDADKGTPVTIELAVYIQVSNVVDAKVQFNEAGLATNSDLQHVDSTSVHNIGNETIDGVKTFTQPIKGVADINVRQLWDGYDLDSLKTAGMYSANNVKVIQSPSKETFSLIVEVSGQSVKQTKSVFNQDGTSSTYIRYYNNKWSDFKKFTVDDSQIANINSQNEFKENTVFDKNVTVGGDLHANADWSHNSEHALNSDKAGKADWANGSWQSEYVNPNNNQTIHNLTVTGSLHANADNAVHSDKSSYADKAGSSGWANGAGQADKSSYADKSGTSDTANALNPNNGYQVNGLQTNGALLANAGASIKGNTDISGDTYAKSLNAKNWSKFDGGIEVNNGITNNGWSNFASLYSRGDITIDGNVNANKNVNIIGKLGSAEVDTGSVYSNGWSVFNVGAQFKNGVSIDGWLNSDSVYSRKNIAAEDSVISKKRYVGYSDAWQGFRFWFDRIGNTVTVDISGWSNVKIDGWVAFAASVPVGYRPAHNTNAVIFVGNAAGFIQVGSDGSLYNGGVWNVFNGDYDKQVRVIGTWTTLDDLPS
ncbi:hypothetical protein [Fructobacillus tropaeoli]|uniref:hypothetical protein n=1 Tax=Fructobacillus tropaeoli TaxID=709323 RepID=UPI0019445287|nr:hypothetical protein [Fructobacillus tropaeoli]GIC70628.1 hypothetical protein FT12353_13040 [Fructobacillus tropaeoli]